MRAETLILELMADTSQLTRDINAAIDNAAKKVRGLEDSVITVKAPLKYLQDLNKELDLKERHIKQVANVAKNNPIVVNVDYDEVTEAIKELKELKKEIKEAQDYSVSVGNQRNSSQQGGRSGSQVVDSTLFEEATTTIREGVKTAINKAGDFVTAPLAGIGRGFFEGFGQVMSKELSQGIMQVFDDDVDINLSKLGRDAAQSIIDAYLPQLPQKRDFQKKIEESKKTLNQMMETSNSLFTSAKQGKLDRESGVVSELRGTIENIMEELSGIQLDKKVPSQDDVFKYASAVNQQLNAIAEVSEQLAKAGDIIERKIRYKIGLSNSVAGFEKRIDSAFNTEDYNELKKVRKEIKREIASFKDIDDDDVKQYVATLRSLSKRAKIDTRSILKTTDAPNAVDYLLRPQQSANLMIEKAKEGVSELVEAVTDPKKVMGKVNQGVRAIAPAAAGAYGIARGAEKALFSFSNVGPVNVLEVVKALVQAGGGAALVHQTPVIGELFQLLGGSAGHLAAQGTNVELANALLHAPPQLGAGANLLQQAGNMAATQAVNAANTAALPVIQAVTETVAGVTSTAVEFVAEVIALLTAGKLTVEKAHEMLIEPQTQKVLEAQKPLMLQAESLAEKATQKQFSSYIDKAKNLPEYVASLPASQQDIAKRFIPVVASFQQGYRGALPGQQLAEVELDLTKIKSPKDVAKLGKEALRQTREAIESQYRVAATALEELKSVMATMTPDDRRGVAADIKLQLQNRVKNLRKKAEYVGLRTESIKIEKPNVNVPTVDVGSVDVSDLSKLERTAIDHGRNMGKGVTDGLSSTTPKAEKVTVEFAKEGFNKPFKKIQEISSPSKLWKRFGEYLGQGIVNGLDAIKGQVEKAAKGVAESASPKKYIDPKGLPALPPIIMSTALNTDGVESNIRESHFKALPDFDQPEFENRLREFHFAGAKGREKRFNNVDSQYNELQTKIQGLSQDSSAYDVADVKKDIYDLLQQLESIKRRLMQKVVDRYGVGIQEALSQVEKVYSTKLAVNENELKKRLDKLDTARQNVVSGVSKRRQQLQMSFNTRNNEYESLKQNALAPYTLLTKRIESRMKKEMELAKEYDNFIRKTKQEINAKYKQRIETIQMKMLRELEGKSDNEIASIRSKYARKQSVELQRRNTELSEYQEKTPSVQRKYQGMLDRVERESQGAISPIVERQQSLANEFDKANRQLSQKERTMLADIERQHSSTTAEFKNRQEQLIKSKQNETRRIESHAKVVKEIDGKISKTNKLYDTVTGQVAQKFEKGTVEFYDNFFNKIKGKLDGKFEGLSDQIITYLMAVASSFVPQLGGVLTAVPVAMNMLPIALSSAAIGMLVAPMVGKIDQALRQQEPISMRFTTLEGTPEAGAAKQQEIMDIATRYSIPIESATANFSQMAIAARNTNLTSKEMLDLFDGISASIKALGLTTQDADLIFMAYTQMLSKGKVSMEELRQQLGERFPPAMSIFAKSLGVSTAALDDLVSRGAIGTEQWVPKVTKVLQEDFGKAALSAGNNYSSALTKIENVNFELNKNFAESYGGLFATVANTWADILDVANKNFDFMSKLAQSALIAIGASIAIGTSYILKTPALSQVIQGGTNLFLSIFKTSLRALTPFMIGTLADVMDDVLGAKNSVFDNMSKGVANFFAGIFTGIDQNVRNNTGMGMFDPFQPKQDNPFEMATKGIQELISKIPSGVIEMTALILMFEQVRVLGSMFVFPMFKDVGGAIAKMSKAVKDAVFTLDTGKRTFGDLFGGSLMAVTGVNRTDVLDKYKKDFDDLRRQQRELNKSNPLADFGRAREAIINNDLELLRKAGDVDVTRKDVIEANKAQFDKMARDYGLQVSESGKYLPNPQNDPLVKYHERRDALLKEKMNKEARMRALAFGGQIALEAALALGVMSFAKGDFSNTIGSELNKTKSQMIASINSMNLALEKLKGTAKDTANSFAQIKLPSKGAQLDIRSLWDETKDFKWDDLVKNINNKRKSSNPVVAGLAEFFFAPMDGEQIKKQAERITKAAQLGLKDFYPKDAKVWATMAEDQLLNNAIDMGKQLIEFKKLLATSDAFDINDLSKPLAPRFKTLMNEVNGIDDKLKELGGRRVELAMVNTTQSRKEIGKLDIEINSLLKTRKDKVRPFAEIEDAITELNRYVQAQSDAIENSNLPLAAKRVLQRNLEPLKNLNEEIKKYFNAQGINQLAKPLEDVWDRVVNKLKDVESQLNRITLKQRIAFNTAQENIYRNAVSPIDLGIDLQKANLADLKAQKTNIENALNENRKALRDVLAIANVGDTSEKKSRIEDLRKTIADQTQQVSELSLSIQKTAYEIKTNYQKEDSLRGMVRGIREFNRGIESRNIEIRNVYRDWQRTLDDTVYDNQLTVRRLGEAYQDLMFNMESQLETSRNELLNLTDQINSEKQKQASLSITPGVDSYAKQLDGIFSQLFDSLTNGESEKRQANLEAVQTQKQYIDSLRQIRDIQEQEYQARKDQIRKIEDLNGQYSQLIRQVQDMYIKGNQERDDFIRTNKREGYDVTKQLAPAPNFANNQRSQAGTVQPMIIYQNGQTIRNLPAQNPVNNVVPFPSNSRPTIQNQAPVKPIDLGNIDSTNNDWQSYYWQQKIKKQLPPAPKVNQAIASNLNNQLQQRAKELQSLAKPSVIPTVSASIPKKVQFGRASISHEELIALQQTAMRLGMPLATLLTIMLFETKGTLNPSIQNSKGATGLIQFMPATARRLGTTVNALKKMSFQEQLPYVEKYFKLHGWQAGMSDLEAYATVLGGNPRNINSKDSNGTNALSGMQRMNRQHRPIADNIMQHFGILSASPAFNFGIPESIEVGKTAGLLDDLGGFVSDKLNQFGNWKVNHRWMGKPKKQWNLYELMRDYVTGENNNITVNIEGEVKDLHKQTSSMTRGFVNYLKLQVKQGQIDAKTVDAYIKQYEGLNKEVAQKVDKAKPKAQPKINRPLKAAEYLNVFFHAHGLDWNLINEGMVDALAKGQVGKKFKMPKGFPLQQQHFENYLKLPETEQARLLLEAQSKRRGKIDDPILVRERTAKTSPTATAPIIKQNESVTAIKEGVKEALSPAPMAIASITAQNFTPEKIVEFNPNLPKVPKLQEIQLSDYDALKERADSQKSANESITNQKLILAQTKQDTAYLQTINDLQKMIYSLQDANRNKLRGAYDMRLEIASMVSNAKGYLTAAEQNFKVGSDMFRQIEDKRRQLADMRLDESRKQADWDKEKAILVERIESNDQLTLDQKQQAIQRIANLDTLIKESQELQKHHDIQLDILNADNNRMIQLARIKDAEIQRNNAIKEYADITASLATARYNLGGELINNGTVISAKMNALVNAYEFKEKLKTLNLSTAQMDEMVKMQKELSDINIAQSYVDAIPFLKEFSTGLKDAILQTTTWNDALKKLLDLVAGTILDQMVIKPIQLGIANILNDWGIFGNTEPINPPALDTNSGFSQAPFNEFGAVDYSGIVSGSQALAQSIQSVNTVIPDLGNAFVEQTLTTTQNTITEQTALMTFVSALTQASAAVLGFSASLGGKMFGAFNPVSEGLLSGFTGDTLMLPTFANGVDNAMKKERNLSGKSPFLAVLHEGEAVLSTLNGDAQLWRALKANGDWNHLKADNPKNFAFGSEVKPVRTTTIKSGDNVQISMVVNASNADSFRKSERRILSDMEAQIKRNRR